MALKDNRPVYAIWSLVMFEKELAWLLQYSIQVLKVKKHF